VGLFRHRDFRQLWIADALSQFGDRINLLAVPLLAATLLHASIFDVAMLRTLQMLAYLLIGLQVGAWCDRLRSRPILIIADLARAAVFGSIPIAAAFGVLSLWQLFAVVTVAGTLTVFFEIAHQTYLPRLIDRERLVEGNARLQTNVMVAGVSAPTLSGYLIQGLGGQAAIGANALSFLWSAVWLRRIRKPEHVPERVVHASLRREIADGLRFVSRQPLLRALAGDLALMSLFQSIQISIAVMFLLHEIHLSPGEIGLISTTGLTGALLGAVIARPVGAWLGEARALCLAAVLCGSAYLLFPLTQPGWGLTFYVAAGVVSGFAIVVGNVLQVSFQQAVTPERLRGRVNATLRFVMFGMTPIGSLLGGVLASTLGLRTTLWIAGGGVAAAGAWLVCSPLLTMRVLPEVYASERPGSPAT
jgi:MFS family permease